MLKNEAINIRNGPSPDTNTGMTAQLKPVDTEAAVATNGATDHINQVTLFGLVCPLNMERMYTKAASNAAKAARITRYSNIRYSNGEAQILNNTAKRRKEVEKEVGFYASHLRGMSWKVPSGRVLRIVMGNMFASNSDMAMSIGLVFSAASTRIGAPIEI